MSPVKYAVVKACFNSEITDGLLEGAFRGFVEKNVSRDAITVVEVPGSWEIPIAVEKFAATKKYAAIVTLGAVIQGETSHDYWINQGIFPQLQSLAVKHSIPVTLGIITCDTWEKAKARSASDNENRGYTAAQAAVVMAKA